jgi:sulfoacetaldehyde dehydrogenase
MAENKYATDAAPATSAESLVAALVRRARDAQARVNDYTQQQADRLVAAVGWAILEPARNRALAELAVADTKLGNVPDKITKNHRKTLGLLRDLQRARSVGVISDDPALGLTEIARPVGVVAAITPSTNPGATPANKIINAVKGRNAVIIAPSPKGAGTCALLIKYVHAEFDKIGAPRDLVQMLPMPITKDTTNALMRAADLIVATGSQANIRQAYSSGTPAFGVGAGNVASIIDASADLDAAAARITRSKTFDNATSCSSENSAVIDARVYGKALDALTKAGGVMLNGAETLLLQAALWTNGALSPKLIAQSAPVIAAAVGLTRPEFAAAKFLMVEETGFGPDHPFSGEKLCPVLTVYRAQDFTDAGRIVTRIYDYQGAGHSVSLHSTDPQQALALGMSLKVCRVIVNQAHAIATGGSFDNGLPFSLSMGCGTWGGNNFSDNMTYRNYLNITRISRTIPERMPSVEDVLGGYLKQYGR